jgi:[protein-PII] uridylyltransferase
MANEKAANRSLDRAVVDRLKAELLRGREAIAGLARLMLPTRGLELAHAASDLADDLVTQLAVAARSEAKSEVAIVPVGGYGRRELCPRSDIDLLFLVRTSGSEAVSDFVNAILYGLWDLGFEVGHAVRTVEECVRFANEDQAIKTALLDARFLSGAEDLFRELKSATDRELRAGAERFITQKLEEAERRRERFGNTVYLLEPNVKASEGGLRELHTARWIAEARWGSGTIRSLSSSGVLAQREVLALERAYGFLLRVRIEMHLASGRRQDALSFDLQERIAVTLGYLRAEDSEDYDKKKHGVERFMRAYYFHAQQIVRIARQIIDRATAAPSESAEQIDDPAKVMRVFRVAQEEGHELHRDTKDRLVEAACLIDWTVRRQPEVVADFLSLLEDPKGDGAILEQMHELGVLRHLMPEVARMSAKWQHSLYHVYTVDVHSLFVVKHLKLLRLGEYSSFEPELTRLISEIPRPNVVYLAAFLHDIGKGWKKGDHSVRGAAVAETITRRFEEANVSAWTKEDSADVIWLVREHLTMSDISQRRDVSDHDLIESFAASCKTIERLSMLYLLTFADMKGTSPKVWTDWKSTLLREVYEVTHAVLAAGRSSSVVGVQHAESRRKRLAAELKRSTKAEVASFVRVLPERYMLAIPTHEMARHVEMFHEVKTRGGIAVQVKQLSREGSTRLTIVCPDRPGLLALLAGTLAANRFHILWAQIFNIEELAVDVLYLTDENGAPCDDPLRIERVRADLLAVIEGQLDVKQLLQQRLFGSTLKERPRPPVKTEIEVQNDISKTETVVDVFCQDRLGALYTIAQAFADAGLTISVAKISTQGDRVADGFYVVDAKTGQKISEPAAIAALEVALYEAINTRPTDRPAASDRADR